MNTKLTALTLAATSVFAFTPKPASAHDGGAIAGAIIGGAILGAAIASADNCAPAPVYVAPAPVYLPPPGAVYVAPAPVYSAPAAYVGGYWDTVAVNIWVPGVWITERDYYGRPCRRWVAPHYERRSERRWVAHNRYDYHGRPGGGREVSGGYGRDRHDDRRDYRHEGRDRRGDYRR